jgi:hypothetical protein
MTHQEIIDRLEAAAREHGVRAAASRAVFEKERSSLQELCGGLGHLFGYASMTSAVLGCRQCLCCGESAQPSKVV